MHRNYKILTWLAGAAEPALKNALEDLGYKLISCSSATELDQKAAQFHHNIGLVIIDESAGDVRHLCKHIKKNELLNCYILVVAAKHTQLSEDEILDSGADLFVTKPLKTNLLVKRIDALLQRK